MKFFGVYELKQSIKGQGTLTDNGTPHFCIVQISAKRGSTEKLNRNKVFSENRNVINFYFYVI